MEAASGRAGYARAVTHFSTPALARMHDALAAHVAREAGLTGLVALVSRRGETHADAIGALSEGGPPMTRDTIFRIASMTKPITAAAAMLLVEDGVIGLDDPVDRFLPELANRKVLRAIDSPLDDVVPLRRPITLRDLLALTCGFGMILAAPGRYPVQKAYDDAGMAPAARIPRFPPDEWMARLAALPSVRQPGEAWMYHSGLDVTGVLIARATGKSFSAFLRERIFDPLGMKDSGFFVPPEKITRFMTSYGTAKHGDGVVVFDDPINGVYREPPPFESGASGLVSTVDDLLAFHRMLLGKGAMLLSPGSVALMTHVAITPEQRATARNFLDKNSSWGLGMTVVRERNHLSMKAGAFGWEGGYGTSAFADPSEDLVGVLLTTRLLDPPATPEWFTDFWTLTYEALS